MDQNGFTLFDTAIGKCGVAWSGQGIAAVQLPEARVSQTRARLRRRLPDAHERKPPRQVRRVIDDIVALMAGKRRDLRSVELDMRGIAPFHRRVYEAARAVGPGSTATYGEIAKRAGKPGSARAVGQALGRNPFAIVVPCHRVVAAGGKLGGFSADGGATTKLRILRIEGSVGGENGDLFAARKAPATTRREGRAVTKSTSASRARHNGLGYDPNRAVEHLRAADAQLARLMQQVGPFRLEPQRTPDLFAALAEAIVYQQLTGKAAETIFGRVRQACMGAARARKGALRPADVLGTGEGALRAAGLSRAKLLALKDLAARAEAGEIPTPAQARRMTDDELVVRLTEVRGVGRWTVEMLLIFRLGRPDVLPVDDYGIRKGFAAAFRTRELPGRDRMEKRAARWRPYRTVASWYLWRAADRAARRP